jgi:hypothetical protein
MCRIVSHGICTLLVSYRLYSSQLDRWFRRYPSSKMDALPEVRTMAYASMINLFSSGSCNWLSSLEKSAPCSSGLRRRSGPCVTLGDHGQYLMWRCKFTNFDYRQSRSTSQPPRPASRYLRDRAIEAVEADPATRSRPLVTAEHLLAVQAE